MTIEEMLQSLRDCDYAECKEWADAIEAALKASDREYLDLMDRRDEAVMLAAHLRIAKREQSAEIEHLRNELADALDVRRGDGPTALSWLAAEIERLREALQLMVEVAPRGVLTSKEEVALKAAYAALARKEGSHD